MSKHPEKFSSISVGKSDSLFNHLDSLNDKIQDHKDKTLRPPRKNQNSPNPGGSSENLLDYEKTGGSNVSGREISQDHSYKGESQ
jgi:hypothetical protein